jgi:D-3-phosphoglycerate dehydrogenase
MATPAQEIKDAPRVSYSLSYSDSASFQSPPVGSLGNRLSQRASNGLSPFETQNIKILLLENVNQTGRDMLTGQGYQVEALKTSLPEAELIEKIR